MGFIEGVLFTCIFFWILSPDKVDLVKCTDGKEPCVIVENLKNMPNSQCQKILRERFPDDRHYICEVPGRHDY